MARVVTNPSIDKPAATTYVAVPGPSGVAASGGSDGADGENAFTTTAADFVMPAIGNTADVTVLNTGWIGLNQILYVENAGYMKATAIVDSTTVTLYNLETATTYTDNVAGGTVVATGSKVSPGGVSGPEAAADATIMHTTDNLAGLATLATARTNLGLGSIAVLNSPLPVANGGTASTTAANARTALGVQAAHANLTGLAALTGAADKLPYFTGASTMAVLAFNTIPRTVITQMQDYGVEFALNYMGVARGFGALNQCKGTQNTIDLNVSGDSGNIDMASTLVGATRVYAFTYYIIRKIIVVNASISLSTAKVEIWTGANRTGTNIVAETALTELTGSTKFKELTLTSVCGTDFWDTTTPSLYVYVKTPQGVAATAEFYAFGEYWS